MKVADLRQFNEADIKRLREEINLLVKVSHYNIVGQIQEVKTSDSAFLAFAMEIADCKRFCFNHQIGNLRDYIITFQDKK